MLVNPSLKYLKHTSEWELNIVKQFELSRCGNEYLYRCGLCIVKFLTYPTEHIYVTCYSKAFFCKLQLSAHAIINIDFIRGPSMSRLKLLFALRPGLRKQNFLDGSGSDVSGSYPVTKTSTGKHIGAQNDLQRTLVLLTVLFKKINFQLIILFKKVGSESEMIDPDLPLPNL